MAASPPRPDGVQKAAGAFVYADDRVREGMLHAATLRSPHAHARIRSLRWHPERAAAGAVVVTAADLPGPNGIPLLSADWPVLAQTHVEHVSQAVALVAAPTPQAARASLAAFEVEYEPLPAIFELDDAAALQPHKAIELVRGDVDGALRAAAHVVEGVWRTGHQEHVYIECQAMTAWLDAAGVLVVEGSMQCPFYVESALTHVFARPRERVRVIATPPGGGFGGKEDYPSLLAAHVALLACAARRPVRAVYDRHEDITATSKRHPSRVRHRTGVDAQGRLLAMEIEITLDGGAFATLSPVVLSRAVLHAAGAYRCPNVRIRARAVKTHTVPNGAFRGFGAPQVLLAVERQLDRIARVLGLDPLEIRLRNALEPGDVLPCGQRLDEGTSARECLEEVARRTDFLARWRLLREARDSGRDEPTRRGVGISLYFHGCGFTGNGERRLASRVGARLLPDGRIELLSAAVEMGQGACALLPQLAAELCGLRESDFALAEPDTAHVPDSGPTVASRTSMIVGAELAHAARELVGEIRKRQGAPREGVAADAASAAGEPHAFRELAQQCYLAHGPLESWRQHSPSAADEFDEKSYQGTAYPTYAWGADVVEVEVDTDTFEVRAIAATAVCEVGRVLQPTLCRGQVEGATLQALGYALCEEIRLREGRVENDRLATYIIPTSLDAPRIDVELLERPWSGSIGGAKGVGELPMNGGAPAALAAIENATGLEPDALPATPERLLALWEQGRVRGGEQGGAP